MKAKYFAFLLGSHTHRNGQYRLATLTIFLPNGVPRSCAAPISILTRVGISYYSRVGSKLPPTFMLKCAPI